MTYTPYVVVSPCHVQIISLGSIAQRANLGNLPLIADHQPASERCLLRAAVKRGKTDENGSSRLNKKEKP